MHKRVKNGAKKAQLTQRFPETDRRQRGIALIIVLWTIILLTVIASGFVSSMRSEAMATRNAVPIAEARWLANGAVERTIYELLTPRLSVEDTWKADGQTRVWQEGDAKFELKAVDEGAFIDLNTGRDDFLRGLLVNTGGLDEMSATHLVDSIANWRTPAEARRIGGAAEADYKKAGLPYGPANAPFEAVEEVSMVLGMTPALYTRVSPFLTVHARQSTPNPRTAPREVLMSFPNVTAEMVDDYLARRQEALINRQPPPMFPGGGGGQTQSVWRIHATVTIADEKPFTRKAVIRRSNNQKRPFIALLWGEE